MKTYQQKGYLKMTQASFHENNNQFESVLAAMHQNQSEQSANNRAVTSQRPSLDEAFAMLMVSPSPQQ